MDKDNEVNKENEKFSTFKLVWERSKKLIYSFIIFLLVTLIISAGIVIWVCISSKNTNTLLWTNYWVMVAAVIPIAGALLSFYFQFEMNEYTKNKEKYLNFQESVQKQQAPKFINFSKTRSPAQNPVLYYKQYLKNKNFKLSPEDIDTINKVISPGKYDLLELGDIIVVRTFKFDIK